MKKVRYIILVVLAAFIVAASLDVAVGEWYATQIYPLLSAALSLSVAWIPFSMTEVLVLCAAGMVFFVVVRGIRRKDKAWKIALREAELVAWIVVWFYLGWGMNYFRESIYTRGNIERQAFDETVFRQFMSDFADSLNQSYTAETKEYAEYENGIKALYSSVPDCWGLSVPKSWQHPKYLIFNSLYTSVGVGGYIGPFFCEIHLNDDLRPAQQPFSYAHELSHLLGVSNEDEANFWAYQICRRSEIPAVRYSGYFSLLPYVLANAAKVLGNEEYRAYVASIKPEIRQQLIEQQEFWNSKYDRTLGKVQSAVYDSMLKVNKIPSGTKNYMQVIELVIATGY